MSNRNDFANKNTEFTGTDGIVLPRGTTGERPSGAVGQMRFNTQLGALENYTEDGWFPVSVPIPTLATVGGTIFAGQTSTLTLTGTNFGIAAGSVRFTASGVVTNVTVTPASATSATVAVPSAVFNLSAGVSVDVQFVNSDNGVSNIIDKTIVALPTGGTISLVGTTRTHVFTSSGSFVVPSGFSSTVNYLVVGGGGGGGGRHGGGGGGGGYISTSTTVSGGTTYSLVIGAGSAGGNGEFVGVNGINSSAFGSTAIGGGGGGAYRDAGNLAGLSGGSGGGAPYNLAQSGAGTSGQGNRGGIASGPVGGAGGGGAGAQGGDASNSAGGAGLQYLDNFFYAGGGGGGNWTIGGNAANGGIGGGGGGNVSVGGGANTDTGNQGGIGGGSARNPGGNGQRVLRDNVSRAAGAGGANTGGGGGSGEQNYPGDTYRGVGGAGGSGIVVVRYTVA